MGYYSNLSHKFQLLRIWLCEQSRGHYPLQWLPRGRWLRKMRHGVPPFPWMHCWGYPGPAAPCPNSEQAQAGGAASSPPAAEGKRCPGEGGGGVILVEVVQHRVESGWKSRHRN